MKTVLKEEMAMARHDVNPKKIDLRKFLWLAIGCLLLLVSNGRWIVPAATWLFPVFIIRYLRTQKHPLSMVICGLGFVGAILIAWQGMIPLRGPLYVIVVGGMGLLVFLPFLADRILAPRLAGFGATLVFPLAYTTVEYITSLVNPFGTFTFLAYTQFGNLPLMQIVGLTGIYGLTFLMTWFGSVANWAWERKFDWPKIHQGIKLYSGLIAGVLLYGGMSLVFLSPKSHEVKIAGVQSHVGKVVLESELAWFFEGDVSKANWNNIFTKTKIVIDDLFLRSEAAAKSGARIVSWAEACVMVSKHDEPAFIDRGKRLARQEQIYLVMAYAVNLHTDPKRVPNDKMWVNKVVFVGPAGDVLSEYRKTIPVPGMEAMLAFAGHDDAPLLKTPYGRLSSLICYDNDFPAFVIKQVGRAGSDIHFDPSGDWEDIDPYHTQMMAFRAIENGFSVVRVTGSGLSAVYDYQGRTLATMDYFKTEDKVFTAHVPEKGVRTVYSKIGDLFSWLAIAGFMTILGRVVFRRKPTIPAS